MCAPWVNLEVPINCVLLEHWNLYIFPFLGACHVCSMGKFGSPHKLCIIRTLEFVYFSFFGGMPMCAPWVNLEVPINCVLLEHWNLYIFPFLGHHAFECPMGKFGSPHKLCIIRTLEFVYFSSFGVILEGPMGKFGSPHKLCIIRTLEFVYFSFFGSMPCVLHG